MKKNKQKGGSNGIDEASNYENRISNIKKISAIISKIIIKLLMFAGFSALLLLLFWFITASNSLNLFTLMPLNNIKKMENEISNSIEKTVNSIEKTVNQ